MMCADYFESYQVVAIAMLLLLLLVACAGLTHAACMCTLGKRLSVFVAAAEGYGSLSAMCRICFSVQPASNVYMLLPCRR